MKHTKRANNRRIILRATNGQPFTLRATNGHGVYNIPVTIICETRPAPTFGQLREMSDTATREKLSEYENILIERNNHVIELMEHLTELRAEKDKHIAELKEYVAELKTKVSELEGARI